MSNREIVSGADPVSGVRICAIHLGAIILVDEILWD